MQNNNRKEFTNNSFVDEDDFSTDDEDVITRSIPQTVGMNVPNPVSDFALVDQEQSVMGSKSDTLYPPISIMDTKGLPELPPRPEGKPIIIKSQNMCSIIRCPIKSYTNILFNFDKFLGMTGNHERGGSLMKKIENMNIGMQTC